MKSKIIFVVLCVLCTSVLTLPVENNDDGFENPPVIQPAALSDNLLNLLLEIRKRMHMEIPSLGLPILEPAKIDGPMELNFDATNIGLLKGSFEKLTIVGIQGFVPDVVDFKLAGFPFLFNITVPQLILNGLFTIDSLLGNMLAVTGEGDFNITLTNVRAYANGRLRFSSNIWTMPELDLLLSVDALETNFNGLYGGNNEHEDFINYALTELGADILAEVYPDFEQTFKDLVIEVAEGALVGKSVLDLMNIVNGNIDLPPLDDDK